MITRLLPDQISKFWPIIKYAVEQSLPPIVGESPDKMNRVLSSAISGKLDVWASYRHEEEQTTLDAIMLTQLLSDHISGTNSLLIYCLYGYSEISNESWMQGAEVLAKFAKANGCSKIIAYTTVPAIVDIAKRFGADTIYTFISLDVNKIV